MDEALKTFLVGVGGTVIGVLLGASNQWFFTRRAERREVQRLLTTLYGEAEGKCLLIQNCAREMTTAHWSLVHRKWQTKNNLVELPVGNNIRKELTEKICFDRMQQEADKFKSLVSQLRTLVSQFSMICQDESIMEKYISIQNYDPLIYGSIVDMDEQEYRKNMFTRLPEVMNAVDNSFGKIVEDLFIHMQGHFKKANKNKSKKLDLRIEKLRKDLDMALKLGNEKLANLLRFNIEYMQKVESSKIVDVRPILKQLSELDLQADPYQEAVNLIKQLGKTPVMIKNLNIGEVIVRARPYKSGEKSFSQVSDLSYKPQKYNNTYQRASTPKRTIFYGGYTDQKSESYNLSENRFTGTLESMRWLADGTTNRMQRIAYGRWDVVSPISLAVILGSKDMKSNNPLMREIYREFEEFINCLPKKVKRNAIAIGEFFSEKFSDPVPSDANHFLYLLSAIWAETCIDAGVEGVLYPSVRTDGEGICVAICPDSCSKLQLKVVGEGIIYKKKKNTLMNNELYAIISEGQTSFTLKPVKPHWKATLSQILEKLETDSIADLEDCR